MKAVTFLFSGLAVMAALAGCGVTAADLPLPGGGVPGEAYPLHAVFADALNLPDKAHVKLNGVDIGRVESIVASNYTAQVSMMISKDVTLPAGTTAELRQATPLGDVFVAMHVPAQRGVPLRSGDTIGIGSTGAGASVEDTLAALSMLVNGGGLGQLKTIVTEVNSALAGHPEQIKHLLGQLNGTLATLNARTGEIDRVLTSAKSLVATAQARQGTIDAALAGFTPAMKVLSDQTGKLTDVLTKVAAAGGSGNRLLNDLHGDLIAQAHDLGEVLDGFAGLKDTLGPTLRGMVTLGRYVQGITKGESGVGAATFAGVTNVPFLPAGEKTHIPGAEDLGAALGTISGNLTDLLKTLGGTR